MIKFDFSTYMPKFESLDSYKEKINKIKNILEKETSMLDWYNIDKCIDEKTLKDILLTSKRVLFSPTFNDEFISKQNSLFLSETIKQLSAPNTDLIRLHISSYW